MAEDIIVWAVIGLGAVGIVYASRRWGGSGHGDTSHLNHRDFRDSESAGPADD